MEQAACLYRPATDLPIQPLVKREQASCLFLRTLERFMPSRFAILAALVVLGGGFVRGEGHRPSLRKLCIDAPLVVLADPVDPVTPMRFKVVLVVRGKDVRPGQIMAPIGLAAADVKTFDEKDLETGKFRPRRISQALLFLTGEGSPRLLSGGRRRCWTGCGGGAASFWPPPRRGGTMRSRRGGKTCRWRSSTGRWKELARRTPGRW